MDNAEDAFPIQEAAVILLQRNEKRKICHSERPKGVEESLHLWSAVQQIGAKIL